MQAFVPKNRKPKFELHLKIVDLNNVPLVNGTSFVKWHLPHSTSAEHRGRTHKQPIRDHKVVYEYSVVVPVRLTIDKASMLQESYIQFEVIQEYGGGGKGERVALGHIRLNLAEYVEASEHDVGEPDDRGVTRRYLMQDSKINSTLKISIYMRQVDGDRNFVAPPLRTAQVFSGIAGIITGEQQETIDSEGMTGGAAASLTRSSREAGEIADMYRRSLAASWFSQPGELAADQCIEDIFAGGDGWGDRQLPYDSITPQTSSPFKSRMGTPGDSGSPSEDEKSSHFSRRWNRHHRRQSSGGSLTQSAEKHRSRWRSRETLRKLPPPTLISSPEPHHISDSGVNGGTAAPHIFNPKYLEHPHNEASTVGPVSGRASLEQQANAMEAEVEKAKKKAAHEVDELQIREDLRSWRL